MPIGFEIVPDLRLVLTIWHGEVTLAQWQEHLSSLLRDPRFGATSLHLVDIRSASIEQAIKSGDIEAILAFLRARQPKIQGRMVAVLSGKELATSTLVGSAVEGLGLVLATFVFSRNAIEWLRLEPGVVEGRLRDLRASLP
jgi:hypothetical protein